jgi:hypothetical protein
MSLTNKIVLLTMLLATGAQGQTVSSVDGLISQGELVTINGSGFGADSRGNITLFDTVESGAISNSWDRNDLTDLTVVDFSRHLNSAKSAFVDVNYYNPAFVPQRPFVKASLQTRFTSDTWFCQYWLYYGANVERTQGDAMDNGKGMRWRPEGDGVENCYIGFPSGLFGIFTIQQEGTPGTAIESQYDEFLYGEARTIMALQTWLCVQTEYVASSVGAYDGRVTMWVNGRKVAEVTEQMTREFDSGLPWVQHLGIEYENIGYINDSNFNYFDDFYCSDTLARVEIGDAPVYDNCTHREIQEITSWGPGAVGITVNTGSFLNQEIAYVFVVGADGTKSAGSQVIINSSYVNPVTLVAPSNLTASGGN